MTTAFYSHSDCRGHDMGRGHPECPERLDAIDDYLIASGLDAALDRREAPLVDPSDLALAHSSGFVAELRDVLEQVAKAGERCAIDPDTIAAPGTLAAASRAAGAAVAATDAVIDGSAANAFCAVRPPGHHATRDQAMGFCFFNSIAVAARHALDVRGLERVAIIDFDVHHGNGTEDIVAGDDRILMASIFQHPLYPYSGTVPKGTNMVNVPVPPYARGPHVRALIEENWMERLDANAERVAIDVSEFHVYAADWRPGRVDFVTDGEHVKTVHQAPDYPMQMMVAVFDFPDKAAAAPPNHVQAARAQVRQVERGP